MARHSLFPNSITINYTSNGHPHKQVLPIGAITGSSPAWEVPLKAGAPMDWRDAVEIYAAVFAQLFSDVDSIDSADLFTYEATDSPAEFLASHPLNQAGLNIAAAQPWTQIVFPFKSIGGNSLRLTAVEQVNPADLKGTFAATINAEICQYLEWVLSDDNFIITRGGTFPTVSLGYTTKVNDKLRRRYLVAS
jgi:hypothetical protein